MHGIQGELKPLAEELGERVAQRTGKLASANEALKAEITERLRAEAALRENEINSLRAV
jgi:C4-dicarboxylate-specific signal transduction histidine kinase